MTLGQDPTMPANHVVSTPVDRAQNALARRRALADLPLFEGLTEAEMDEVAAWSTTRTVTPGRCVYREGEEAQGLYLVLSGELEVVHREDATRESTLPRVGPGDLLGETALLDGRPHSAEVRAITEARVAKLPQALLESFFEQHPSRRLRLRALAVTRRLAKVTNAFSS